MNWKKLLGDVAPTFARVLGGSVGGPVGAALAGEGMKKLLGVLGLPEDIAQGDVAVALRALTPEQTLALAKEDGALAIRMRELGIEEEKIDAADRGSARQLAAAIKARTPAILSWVVTAGFFGVLATMMFHPPPETGDTRDALMIMLGALAAAFTQVLNFWFGSSHGSMQKNELLAGR